jgi:hypothetical protein
VGTHIASRYIPVLTPPPKPWAYVVGALSTRALELHSTSYVAEREKQKTTGHGKGVET